MKRKTTNSLIGNRASCLLVATSILCGSMAALAQTPTSLPAMRTEAEISQSLRTLSGKVNRLINDDVVLSDLSKRQAIAVEAVPMLKQLRRDFDELVSFKPQMARQAKVLHLQVDQTLAILGDAEGTRNLEALAASASVADSLAGQGAQLMVRWATASREESVQTPLVDEIDKLDRAHVDSTDLTMVTATMVKSAATPAVAARLYQLATEVMKNPAVARVKLHHEQAAFAQKLKQMVGKPFVLAAKTVEGQNFTTAAWVGKVVLVDFWATWCGPCKAELPNIQKLYAEQHANGLEIVGVSNDYSAEALRSFVAKANMPWPQLFDAAAAEQEQWNPTTLGYGINTIPHMFVIDRKGILQSADAQTDYAELVKKLLAE